MASAVVADESVAGPVGLILVAGPWAVGPPAYANPSYASPAELSALGGLTTDGQDFAALAAGTRDLVGQLLAADELPPDWVQLDAGRPLAIAPPGQEADDDYGFDAVRLPIRWAASCDATDRRVAAALWPPLGRPAQAGRATVGLRLSGARRPQARRARASAWWRRRQWAGPPATAVLHSSCWAEPRRPTRLIPRTTRARGWPWGGCCWRHGASVPVEPPDPSMDRNAAADAENDAATRGDALAFKQNARPGNGRREKGADMTDASVVMPSRRVEMWYAGTAAQNRWTVAFRIILAIPQYIVLDFLFIAFFFVVVIGWFAALFTGRLPEWANTFLGGVIRWYARVNAYVFLLTDRYPPFSLDDVEYPVRPILPGRGPLNRVSVFFRIILAIPAAVFYGDRAVRA